jgi:hypothetical protein
MRNERLQRLINEFKEWDWVNDNEKVFHEDTVYEMLLHLQQAVVCGLASVSEGEQLGNEAWAKGVSDGCECTILTRKDECKEYTGCPKYMNRV